MERVYKYTLEVKDSQVVKMPMHAKILTAQAQYDEVCIWALVDPDLDEEDRTIRIHGTGHLIENAEKLVYIGTIQLEKGHFIDFGHVFEEVEDV